MFSFVQELKIILKNNNEFFKFMVKYYDMMYLFSYLIYLNLYLQLQKTSIEYYLVFNKSRCYKVIFFNNKAIQLIQNFIYLLLHIYKYMYNYISKKKVIKYKKMVTIFYYIFKTFKTILKIWFILSLCLLSESCNIKTILNISSWKENSYS